MRSVIMSLGKTFGQVTMTVATTPKMTFEEFLEYSDGTDVLYEKDKYRGFHFAVVKMKTSILILLRLKFSKLNLPELAKLLRSE